jgi:hypothetical protein
MLPLTSATFIAGIPNQVLLNSSGGITPVTWSYIPDSNAPWLNLKDNGNGTALLTGTPPVGTTGTFNPKIGPLAAEQGPTIINPFPVTVENIPVFTSSTNISFTVGTPGSFSIDTNQGSVSLSTGTLPNGLSFSSGNTPSIGGTAAPGTGGQYMLALTDNAGSAGSVSHALTLNVYEAPQITSPNTATFLTGMPAYFAVTTTAYPSVSTQPVPANAMPPTFPPIGQGMYSTVTGLPSDLQYSNLNAQGLATGTVTIQGTPSAADAGVHQVQITAQNGVGSTAQQTLMLDIVSITGASPTSGTTCNGNYSGTFHGGVTVQAGQNCSFVGGGRHRECDGERRKSYSYQRHNDR